MKSLKQNNKEIDFSWLYGIIETIGLCTFASLTGLSWTIIGNQEVLNDCFILVWNNWAPWVCTILPGIGLMTSRPLSWHTPFCISNSNQFAILSGNRWKKTSLLNHILVQVTCIVELSTYTVLFQHKSIQPPKYPHFFILHPIVFTITMVA